ncbi:MAG TPA: protein TolQ [Gammaproteobacteria bacterium]|nr:protein TolQ [Gammaproteobacteria bacterium]
MNADTSIIHLITGASFLVQIVMTLLLLASIFSWTIIFSKWKLIKAADSRADRFEDRFWNASDLSDLYKQTSRIRKNPGDNAMESIFEAGFREFARLRTDADLSPTVIMEGAQRSMRVAMNREIDALENNLPFLASTGSTSPYVGLFGTVWGIMNSFRELGNAKQATLQLVAPGIAEALVATAMGLFAAIPAVLAYNRFANQIDRLTGRYDVFYDEFSNVLQRQAHK